MSCVESPPSGWFHRGLYLETATTVGDVGQRYAAIASPLLPHLAERLVTLKRSPDGVGSTPESFLEKDLEVRVPD